MLYLAQQYFTESAKKNPKKTAVVFENQKISYRDLDIYSNQLANILEELEVQKGDRVCFCLYKSLNSIKSIMGILKADAVYVPLDAYSPVIRMKRIIKDVKPKVLICDERTYSIAKKLKKDNMKIVILSKRKNIFSKDCVFENDILKASKSEPEYLNIDTDLSYIFYTSGSTGVPKGVMITHLNLINATEWAVEEFDIKRRDILSSHPPFHFDLSTFDIYCAFKAGATLCLVPEKLSLFPGALLDYIEKQKMTIWNSVPSLLVYIQRMKVLNKQRLSKVKKIFFNGEVFPTRSLVQWMKIFPQKEFVNMYGPTEATVQCTFYRIKKIPKNFTKPVPIGKACGNTKVFAITNKGTLVKAGERGELYVRGSGVSPGYWQDTKKTKESFIVNPFNQNYQEKVYKTGDLVYLRPDGNYEFLGRKDYQIKIRGHRVELGEIESALYSLQYISEAVVTANHNIQDIKIIAFLVFTKQAAEKQIRNDLKRILPSYMIPTQFIFKSSLTKTSAGKIDRLLLKKEYEKEYK